VRKLVQPHLKGAQKVDHRPWQEVLAKEGLYGRYLDEFQTSGQEE
jgi:hypothetical protein